nr:hypothetical protein [uncultured Limnohabitans sp.]
MSRVLALLQKIFISFVLISGSCCAWADPVWHCSRSDVQIANASDDFTLASLSLDREVIRLSLRDLYSVYQGATIKLSGGLPLSACIAGNDINLTNAAMSSIGSNPTIRRDTGTAKNLYVVQNEPAMLACIAKNHPAIGYLSQATHTEAVGPCF